MSTPTKITKKSGGLGRLKSRAAAKATGAPVVVEEPAAVAPAPPVASLPVEKQKVGAAPNADQAPKVPAVEQPAEGKTKARKTGGGEGESKAPKKKRSNYIYVQDAYEAQLQILQESEEGQAVLIDFTDADGGYSSRIRTSIYLAPEAIEAINELEIDEAIRFGKAPKLYHYIELALTRFVPTAKEAVTAERVNEMVETEQISTAVNGKAKLAMRNIRQVVHVDNELVPKGWFYSEAVLRMVKARRKALGL